MGLKLLSYAGSLPENEGLKHFNISHSGGYVAVALADCSVGVDVEVKREISAKVKNKAFSKEEQELLNNEECTPVQLWTLKESYGKSRGIGIAYPLREMRFSPASSDSPWQSFTCPDVNARCYSCMGDDYVLSVCVQNPGEGKPELQLLQNSAWM